MKSSEMIQKIHDRLFGTPIHVDNWEDHILSVVEELGMVPPSRPTGASGWDIGKGAPSYVNEWEPEDEA